MIETLVTHAVALAVLLLGIISGIVTLIHARGNTSMTKAELLDDIEQRLDGLQPSPVAGPDVPDECQRWVTDQLLIAVTTIILLPPSTAEADRWEELHTELQESLAQGIKPLNPNFRPDATRLYLTRLQYLVSRMS